MIDVNGDIKKILLNSIKTNDNYVLLTRNGLVILPINSNVKYLTEEFIRIIEITINSDDNLVISEISSNNNGLVAFSSTWSFYNNVYDQLNGYIVFFDRNDISQADRERKDAVIAIFDELKKKKKHVDTVDLMVQINGILGEYILIEQTPKDKDFAKRFDISKIDFDLLRKEFAKAGKKNLLIKDLDELIQVRLAGMMKENPKRVDYYERYQKIIEEYNSEQDRANIEKTFMELMDLANSMNQEEICS